MEQQIPDINLEIKKQQRKRTLVILILVHSILLLLTIPGILMAMTSPMMFDAPGSEQNKLLWVTVIAVISFPVLAILCIIAAWLLFAGKKYTPAIILSFLPFLNVIVVVILLMFSSALSGNM